MMLLLPNVSYWNCRCLWTNSRSNPLASGSTALFTKTKKRKQAEQADKGIYILKHGKKIKKIFVVTRLETEFKWFAASMFSMV